jgi:hypothetical protein
MPDLIAHTPARADRGLGRDGSLKRNGRPKTTSTWRKQTIRELRERDGDRCSFGVGCLYGGTIDFDTDKWELPDGERPSIEHTKPWCLSRSNDLEHLALAHLGCNAAHGKILWAQRSREGHLDHKIGRITAWPALTYADELEFD